MDLNESRLKIERFERQVMWRKRLLALQDRLAVAVLAGGIIAAALVVYIRLRPLAVSAGIIAAAVMAATVLAALALWFRARASRRDAAFLIDESLDLEDRVATSQAILERGGAHNDFETALLEDAASRVAGQKASLIVPFQLSGWSALSMVGVAALVVALMVP